MKGWNQKIDKSTVKPEKLLGQQANNVYHSDPEGKNNKLSAGNPGLRTTMTNLALSDIWNFPNFSNALFSIKTIITHLFVLISFFFDKQKC